MAAVFTIHEMTLRLDADGGELEEDFERFVSEEYASEVSTATGARVRLLKGVRGERTGRYVLLIEFPSEEAFTRFYPLGPGPGTDEARKLMRDHSALFAKYGSFVTRWLFTDYVEACSRKVGQPQAA